MYRAPSLRTATLLALAASGLSSCLYGPTVCDEIDRHACTLALPTAPSPTLAPYRDRTLPAGTGPRVGSPVAVRNVTVTAIDAYSEGASGSIGDIWVQERVFDPAFQGCAPHPLGGRVCGIQLFAPTVAPAGERLVLGDLVNIAGGTYDEFNCPTCSTQFPMGRTLPELSRTAVQRVGSAEVTVPVTASLDDVINGGDTWVGVLVQLTDEIVLGTYNARYSQYPLIINGTPSRTLNIAEQIAPLEDATGQPYPSGTHLRNVVVIVSYFYNPLLLLRSATSYQVVP